MDGKKGRKKRKTTENIWPLSLLAPPTKYDAESLLYTGLTRPLSLLARLIARLFALTLPNPPLEADAIRVVCISDTHSNQKPQDLPFGEILIHSGDVSDLGDIASLQKQIDWLSSYPHAHKIVVAGNHDTYLDPAARKHLQPHQREGRLNWRGIHYLQHSDITLDFPSRGNRQLKVYGAPQTARLGKTTPHYAFQYDDERDAWTDTIPEDVDILVTHNPPRWHLDLAGGLGCPFLLHEVWRVRPTLHAFGHIHDGHGTEVIRWDRGQLALERLQERDGKGAIRGLLNPNNWLDLWRVVYYGSKTFLWLRLWGGQMSSTTCVNSAWMNKRTFPRSGNPAVVVDI